MEFRVPSAKKKKFTYYYKDGYKVSYVGYFYWEYPLYKELSFRKLSKITYSFDYKDDLSL